MRKATSLLAAMLMATGTAAIAADAEKGASSEDTRREKRICKTEKITGSLTRVRRTCMTQREWDQLAEATRRDVDGLSRDANRAQAMQANTPPPTMPGPGGF